MFWLLFAFLIISFFAWVYRKWTKVRRYWSDRGVTYVAPNFFIGNLSFLQRENPGHWMRRLYEKYKEPYVGVWWFWRPALIINSPEIARNVLVKDFSVFRNRFVSSGTSDPIGGLNLFTVNDPLWSWIRRRLTSIFSAAKLRSSQPLLNTKSKELIQRINSEKDKTKMSLKMVFTDYTTDIIGRAAFGIDGDATLTGKGPMRTVTNSFMKFDFYRGLCWSCIFFWPELVDIFGFSFFPKKTSDYFKKIIRMVSEQRKDMKGIEDPKDLIDALLKLKDVDGTEDMQISEDTIVAQASIFLLGGFDTSGSSLTFVVYELAYHPEAQEKIYNQIKEKHGDETDDLDTTKLAEVTYMNCVIKETLRLFPGMGWIDRIATVDYKVDDHLTIPAGTPVYVNGNGMHYDPEYYPNPEVFDPDRFLPENDKKTFTYMPFGEGPRSCIGKRFGLMSMRHALARLVLNYRFEPLPGAPKPSEIEIEKRGLFYFPGEHMYINFIPRE